MWLRSQISGPASQPIDNKYTARESGGGGWIVMGGLE
jgi:hypothetical protein